MLETAELLTVNHLLKLWKYDMSKKNLVVWALFKALVNFNQNLGIGQAPPSPPLVGPNSQLWPKNNFEGSPNFKRYRLTLGDIQNSWMIVHILHTFHMLHILHI